MIAGSIALISTPDEDRTALARYLTGAGFDVHELDELGVPSAFAALVLVREDDASSSADTVASVRSWLRLGRRQRIIVVTSRPRTLDVLVVAHTPRLIVFPAPVFGFEVVDALRAPLAPNPRTG